MTPHGRQVLAVVPLLLLGAGTTACRSGVTGGMRQPTVAVALVDQYMAGWNAHDPVRAASFFADSGVYYDASVGTPQVGRANAQKNVIEAFIKAVPDCQWSRDGEPVVSAAGDAIAFQWTFSGTNTGAWSDGTKPTNKKFSIRGLSLIRIKDGKIAWQGDYYDALGFYKQVGLM
jgi:steroid delta-isomerase-like uncharacterized protein